MNSWSLASKIGVGVAVMLALLLLLRAGQHAPAPAPPLPAAPQLRPDSEALTPGERVRQGIDPLPAARPAETSQLGDRIDARRVAPQIKAAPHLPPQASQPAAPDDDPESLPALKAAALHAPDPERRLTAVTLLGATEDPQAIPVLAQALADQDEEVRMAALEALSDFTNEPPVEAIQSALNDPSPDIRFEAISVLADIDDARARRAIERALNDPDEDVRTLAEGILDTAATEEHPPADPAAPEHPPAR